MTSSAAKLSYLYYLYDKQTVILSIQVILLCGAAIGCLRVGLSWVLQTEIGPLPLQFGNCQRAIYLRGIAARRLEIRLPSFTDLVVVATEGQTQEISGAVRN